MALTFSVLVVCLQTLAIAVTKVTYVLELLEILSERVSLLPLRLRLFSILVNRQVEVEVVG